MGGVNAILLGAPIMKFVLDIVHGRAAENIKRLLHRRELTPGESRLSGLGNQLLVTKYGMLDVLGLLERAAAMRNQGLISRSYA